MKYLMLILMFVTFSSTVFAETTRNDDSSATAAPKRSSGGGGKLQIRIDLSSSTLTVPGLGSVSIGYGSTKKYGKGARTPTGTFTAGKLGDWLTNKRYGGKRVNLRSAIQISGGILMHEGRGTGPVSHGCVRVPPAFMKKLLAKARAVGARNTKITITQ